MSQNASWYLGAAEEEFDHLLISKSTNKNNIRPVSMSTKPFLSVWIGFCFDANIAIRQHPKVLLNNSKYTI